MKPKGNRLNSVIQKFVDDISDIHDPDYGDFMRKANLYINNLREELRLVSLKEVKERINQMQSYVQFFANWEIESTKERIFNDAEIIDSLLSNNGQKSYRKAG